MAGERLPARFSHRSQLRFRWTGKCFETATSHMQTVVQHLKKIFHILKFAFIFSIFGCQNNSEWENLNSYFLTHISNEHPMAEIDFTKRKAGLVEQVENQTGIDLCDSGLLIGTTNYKSRVVKYPVYVFKTCDDFLSIHNIVEIEISTNNQVLVDYELVPDNVSVFNKVLKATGQMMERKGRNRLLYSLNWEKGTNPEFIKQRLFETLNGIKFHADSISEGLFKKKIEELSESELNELNDKFLTRIIFDDYERIPLEPPKPVEQDE